MSLIIVPKTVKWPFFAGDALLIAAAWFVCARATAPFDAPTLAACVACVAIGAVLGIAPYVMDYRAEVRLAESNGLADTVEQIRGLETIAAAVASATGKWQSVHEHATEAVNSARQVSQQMSEEMKSFMEFLEKANDSERQHLTLEVDKLKRAESDWLGVLVRILDHAFALRSAAIQSGQQRVIDQLTQFQIAIRDVARRVGLTPLEAEAGAEFDSARHQPSAGGEVPAGARISTMMATGYSFRGQMIRPVIVEVEGADSAALGDESVKTAPTMESSAPSDASSPND